MRNVLILVLLCLNVTLFGTTYYVSSSGNDGANGTSTNTPWATLNKVNGFSFVAGDNILFNRGDTWYGTLIITHSGTSGSRITYGVYGTGVNPIITGFITISGWTYYGGGIYSKAVSSASIPTNMVTVNGVNTGKGRYPKDGNWLWNTTVGTGYITDNSLPSSPNWTGAQIFMKTEGYRWNHGTITSQSTHQINYTQQGGDSWCGGNGYNGWGYFLDNDLRTLSTINGVAPQLGEWFHNGTTFYMYFGAVDPTTKVVKVATLDFGIICHQSYITIDNISIIGFNGDHTSFTNGAVNLGGTSNYVSVTNCEIGFIGASAVWIGEHTTIDNCYIHDTNGQTFLDNGNYFTLTNNIIENIGLIYSSMGGWSARGTVMDNINGTNQLIQYNIFRHVGSFCAKTNGAANVTIDKNLFDDCVIRAIDAGCIYVNGLSANRVISNNICLNTGCSLEGISGTLPDIWYVAPAIYLDTPNSGITVTGNTVTGTVNGPGIMISASHENTISNNTLYNNYQGFQILSEIATDPTANLQFTNNKIIAASTGQLLTIIHITYGSIPTLGFTIASGDIYARPVNDGVDQDWLTCEPSINGGHNQYQTYAQWLSRSGETGSTFSSITTSSVNNIHFNYNASKSNKVVALDGGYVDVVGTKYSGSITLLPYTSVVLMADPNSSAPPASPAYVSSAIENATPNILTMTYNMTLANIAPATSAFSVKVNTVSRTVNAVVVSGTKIQLTLATRIVPGDRVTVSYAKPSTSPIQTTAGGIATNISNQQVINNCVNVAPTAVITSPVTNSSFAASSNIIISATVLDSDGSVSLVEFYSGNTKLGSNSVAPYSFTWKNVPSGNYSLTVIAIDNLNTKTTSSAISISVTNIKQAPNKHPIVKIFNPHKGNTFENLSTITIDAIASDPDGTVDKVEFYNGQVKLVELTSAPYTYSWKDVVAGNYSIIAIATDNLNDTTVSSPVKFEVGSTVKYDVNSEIVKLYPNPNNGHFSIEFINPLQNDKSEIIITDLSGKQIYNGLALKEETLKQIDVSGSRSGIYVMMIKDKEILVTKKFIKN